MKVLYTREAETARGDFARAEKIEKSHTKLTGDMV